MQKFTQQYVLQHPVEAVWEQIDDFAGVASWNPVVNDTKILTKHDRGLGAKRHCNLNNGFYVKEEITHYQAGESLQISLFETSMPMKRSEINMQLDAQSATSTRIVITTAFEPKFGIFGGMMGYLIIRPMMRRLLNQSFKALEQKLGKASQKALPSPA